MARCRSMTAEPLAARCWARQKWFAPGRLPAATLGRALPNPCRFIVSDHLKVSARLILSAAERPE